jgi:RHH-type transcriptional regulator, proline utilization regulon repressor / proline dehydrogenase / delta 1-pyrroline-5-carboxylate dehydrogenase
MNPEQDLEKRIRLLGLEIYTSMWDVPTVFDTEKWMGTIMKWAMKDSAFKTGLFRFIDVLPSLKTDELVVRLLHEYFAGINTPKIIRSGIERMSRQSFLPSVTARLVRRGVESLARQFIAGRSPEAALQSLEALMKENLSYSIDLLGEAVVSDREAGDYRRRYLELLLFLHAQNSNRADTLLGHDLSLKISSFYSQLDPTDWEGSREKTKDGLRPILRNAKDLGISVTFDMEHYFYKDLTIEIFRSLLEEDEFKNLPPSGIALQAYLKDTKEDLLKLIDWAKRKKRLITVRLVKGAYWDYEMIVNRQKGWPVPVFLNKEETDRNFEELTKTLLDQSGFIRPAIATHNLRSLSNAIALADSSNLSGEAVEFQMLYGMAEPLRAALLKMHRRVRVYTPVGELIPGMAYLVRRLLENTSNESFLRRSFVEKEPFEELIKAPQSQKIHADVPRADIFRNEPPLDFSRQQNRERMVDAINTVRKKLNARYPLYIGGKEIWNEKETVSLNPATVYEVVGRVSAARLEDAEDAIAQAKRVCSLWRKTAPKERAGYLFRAAEEMRRKRFELAALEIYEVGKTWREADGDVAEAIDYLEYYAREMIRLGIPKILGNYVGEENEYLYYPKGIGVVISPWNFPLAIATGMVSAGIVTGNCIIFKPSALSPVTGYKLVEIFRLSGLPQGVLQFLPGSGGEIGEYLVTHPEIDFIAFTGSREVGLRIIKLAGETRQGQRTIKKVVAEMGGKNAVIVDETADIDVALKSVLESAMGYQGQKCSACSRVIIVGNLFNEFLDRLKESMESVRIGPPVEPGTFMGPVIDEVAWKKITGYIEIGKKEGKAVLIRDGGINGYYLGPAIFKDVSPVARIAQEEIFGPVISVMKARDIAEALHIANSTPYALTGGLFSRTPSNIKKVKDEFIVGNLYINRTITGALVGRQPFGGFGMSGKGSKTGGPDYLLQFMNPRCRSENTLRRGFVSIE